MYFSASFTNIKKPAGTEKKPLFPVPTDSTGITNIVTNYFQAIGKPLPSIVLTILKNIVLLIPALAVMDNLWGLTGVIACQPVVEYVIAALSLLFYWISIKKKEKNIA